MTGAKDVRTTYMYGIKGCMASKHVCVYGLLTCMESIGGFVPDNWASTNFQAKTMFRQRFLGKYRMNTPSASVKQVVPMYVHFGWSLNFRTWVHLPA